jgi:hypothetical protein
MLWRDAAISRSRDEVPLKKVFVAHCFIDSNLVALFPTLLSSLLSYA